MDIRAKERLTGAVILVVMIVLVVPELLTGPRQRAAPAAETGDQPPLRSYTVDLTDGARQGAATGSGPLTQSPGTSSATAAPVSAPAAAPADDTSGSADEQPPPAASESSAGANAAATHAPAPKEPPPRAPPAASVTHGAHAAAAPRTAAPQTAAQADTGAVTGWSVQLGSFASRENADRLVHELKARRFSAFVSESTSDGRKLYRVRVGPESDHAAAQTLATRLRSAGHTGSIVPNP